MARQLVKPATLPQMPLTCCRIEHFIHVHYHTIEETAEYLIKPTVWKLAGQQNAKNQSHSLRTYAAPEDELPTRD